MRLLSMIALVAALAWASAARAQDAVADFYRGKRITLQVGSEAGGGYDVVAHVVAAHLGAHIPGTPQIIVQDVPGGGSLLLANLFRRPRRRATAPPSVSPATACRRRRCFRRSRRITIPVASSGSVARAARSKFSPSGTRRR